MLERDIWVLYCISLTAAVEAYVRFGIGINAAKQRTCERNYFKEIIIQKKGTRGLSGCISCICRFHRVEMS